MGSFQLVMTSLVYEYTDAQDFHRGEVNQMTEYHKPPIEPMAITFDADKLTFSPEGPTLVRRMSDLEGLFEDQVAWKKSAESENPIVYSVVSTPIPEVNRELPQSITTLAA
jgi:glucose-6-phosphate isomerase